MLALARLDFVLALGGTPQCRSWVLAFARADALRQPALAALGWGLRCSGAAKAVCLYPAQLKR